VVWAGQSGYADLRVLDLEDARYFVVDGGIHTIESLQEPGRSLHRYATVVDLAKLMFASPGRLLLLGLGGGSVAKSFAADGWRVDAVEIDPKVVQLARQYFDVRSDSVHVHVQDGRRFLTTARGAWDVIVLDAYGSSAIPFHLVTREVFAECKSHLAPNGLLILNVEGRGWKDPIFSAIAATLRTSFRTVISLPTGEPPNALGNTVMIATDRSGVDFPEQRLERPYDVLHAEGDGWHHWATVQRNHAWDNRFVPDSSGTVLTDDLNPVDLWAEEINREARGDLHRFFGAKAPSW
jgi:spermidine synthase